MVFENIRVLIESRSKKKVINCDDLLSVLFFFRLTPDAEIFLSGFDVFAAANRTRALNATSLNYFYNVAGIGNPCAVRTFGKAEHSAFVTVVVCHFIIITSFASVHACSLLYGCESVNLSRRLLGKFRYDILQLIARADGS